MSAGLRFSYRGVLIWSVLVFGFVDAARANVFDDIGDFFFGGNAPEVASSQDCDNYARGAMLQATYAQQYVCPLSGPRYGTYEKGHYGWCMGVTHETSNVEASAREREVAACMSLSNQAYCSLYGIQAAKDAHDNKLYNCGFTGPRWGEGSEGHRGYCLSQKIAQRLRNEVSNWPGAELTARGDAIEKCTSKHSKKKIQFCNSYSIQAVAAATTFKEKNCDRSQNWWGRWGSDYDHHFSWCIGHRDMTTTANAGNSETGIRTAAVNACVARGGGPPTLTPVVNRNSGAFGPLPATKVIDGITKTVAPVSNTLTKPASKGNTGPSSSGAYLSKPIDGNSAMDRLTPGGGVSGGGSSTLKSNPRPSVGGSSGISTSKPISPPSGGSSSGISTSKPISPPSGGSSSGINLSR